MNTRAVYSPWQTWWTILRVSLAERLAYRGDFALGTLMRFLPIITQIFLWHAIFQNPATKQALGLSYEQMVAYYLLTMLTRAFSSMPGLASSIAAQIRTGEIKKFLIQPIGLMEYYFLSRVAHKLAYYAVAIGPFALVFFLCRGYFDGWPAPHVLCVYIISLLLSFLLGFYLEACMGLVGFWFLEVGSLLFVFMLFSFFLSGHMFPLDILPEPWPTLIMYSPFPYLAYFSSDVFLGRREGWELYGGLAIQAFWTVFFMLLSNFLLARGLKRYSAFGG
jgi:ABC-2 type transport system permease protein